MQTEAYQNNVIQGFYATAPKAESTALLPLFWPSLADNFCPWDIVRLPTPLHLPCLLMTSIEH